MTSSGDGILASRLYVDNADRSEELEYPYSEARVDVGRGLTEFCAVELSSCSLPGDMLPTFIETAGNSQGNNLLDVHVELQSDAATSLDFTVAFDAGKRYYSLAELAAAAGPEMDAAMDASGHATFSTANDYSFTVNADYLDNEADSFVTDEPRAGTLNFNLSGPAEVFVQFLFGTGPSAGSCPERVFGFDRGVDTLLIKTTPPSPFEAAAYLFWQPRSYRLAMLRPFRFADVVLQQPAITQGGRPLSRVLVSEYGLFLSRARQEDIPQLLELPVRGLSRMRLRLVLDGGRLPAEEADQHWSASLTAVALRRDSLGGHARSAFLRV